MVLHSRYRPLKSRYLFLRFRRSPNDLTPSKPTRYAFNVIIESLLDTQDPDNGERKRNRDVARLTMDVIIPIVKRQLKNNSSHSETTSSIVKRPNVTEHNLTTMQGGKN